METWHKNIQLLVDAIDECIKQKEDETLTLRRLGQVIGYSEYTVSKKFREIAGMHLRDYLRYRRLAFALKALRDTQGI